MTDRSLPSKLNLAISLFIVAIASHAVIAQEAQPWSQNTSPLPASTGFVNDYVGVFDQGTKQQLETKLKNLRDTTDPPVEIAVAVVDTTGEHDIFDYSLAVARGWGIGSKADDNPSALLLIAVKDRKYFTQISKDLEDELPDGLVGSLQRQYLVPEFRKGNYAKGISDTVDAYIATIRKTNLPAAAPNETPGSGRTVVDRGGSGLFCCAIIILVLLVIIFSRSKGGPTKGDRDRWGGGGFGGGGGGVGGSALPWIIGSILASGSGSSGSSSSSDWGGSSGGWGGFGGGGDFGGGGAGGDW